MEVQGTPWNVVKGHGSACPKQGYFQAPPGRHRFCIQSPSRLPSSSTSNGKQGDSIRAAMKVVIKGTQGYAKMKVVSTPATTRA